MRFSPSGARDHAGESIDERVPIAPRDKHGEGDPGDQRERRTDGSFEPIADSEVGRVVTDAEQHEPDRRVRFRSAVGKPSR